MERIGCFFELNPTEVGEAAKNFDDQLCSACPNWDTCLKIDENERKASDESKA
jgi:hypothetical protein